MERKSHVKVFFDDTEKYLGNNYGIAFRRDIVSTYTSEKKFNNIHDVGRGDGSLSYFLLNESNQLSLMDIFENMLLKAE